MPQSEQTAVFFLRLIADKWERKDVKDDKRNLQGNVGRQIHYP